MVCVCGSSERLEKETKVAVDLAGCYFCFVVVVVVVFLLAGLKQQKKTKLPAFVRIMNVNLYTSAGI